MKKIIKLSVLLIIRQVWGWCCNLYLLSYQPFLTLRTIKAKRDKSQFLLISATALFPVLMYISARVVTDYWFYGQILSSVGMIFGLTMVIEVLIFAYLLFWTVKVLGGNQIDLFVDGV
ncbi:hypothetical protein KKC08_02100 [Patescibacteria group bacterium]|nr:hypothetical protein [Patescibacteria group bacterium]MCG2702747.1 hypothetical protein [Candidatus Parcubacteria bacterium]MBU4209950.1 hypothetical protein [Patescibacteria group bacterium]MBU4265448.1 hypothetical protein [Patescibacteria group bacterium]MBU4390498.1 hypothetical protein [Patescibacteria group bacterium]